MIDWRGEPCWNGEDTPTEAMRDRLREISGACVECDLCQKECAFLRKYGKPKEIADRYDPALKDHHGMAFECSLCGLCTAVCPAGIDPAGLFLEMRREAVRRGSGGYPEHAALRGYERRGTSRAYTYYGLPKGCDTVFFPGCALSGTRSDKVILSYQKLKEQIPSVGIVLDCCMKPSHDLGMEDRFIAMFAEMREYLLAHGIKTVLVACPNCYRMFAGSGKGLAVKTIYEVFGEDGSEATGQASGKMTVHDPCVVRFDTAIHNAVRKLVKRNCRDVEEMAHTGRLTVCCGEGGAVGALAPNLAGRWGRLCQEEAADRRVVTYCAGCADTLSKFVPTVHVLDLLWEEKGRRPKVTKPPFTYWKRLRLKKWFKTHVAAAVTRERTFTGTEETKKGSAAKFLIFLLFLSVVIAAANIPGVSLHG